jgi:Fe-S-cluster-containing hydrogenase component 2
MNANRKIIRIDEEKCDGCGLCVPACAEGAIRIVDGKARLVSDRYCDGLGACLGDCPRGALEVIEREAEAFDEFAVIAHLKREKQVEEAAVEPLACGCPGTHLQTFLRPVSCEEANRPVVSSQASSALGHWPVQIRLVPPTAPFLKGASLLVAADCVPVAYPALHRDFLPGRVVMIGCPKFDDPGPYVEKFARIFAAAEIRDVTVLVMEVPCCQGLPMIVRRGMEMAGKDVPLRRVVISTEGTVCDETSKPAAPAFPVVEAVKA